MRGIIERALLLVAIVGFAACESERKKDTNPFADPSAAPKLPPIEKPPEPEGPPEFVIHAAGPKIGWTNIQLEKPEGPQKLAAEIQENKEHVDGKVVALTIDRKAKLPWVVQMTGALADAGATAFEVTTSTRTQFPKKVTLIPISAVSSPPSCSVVGKVLAERRNAVWQLRGGTAVRSPKGLAGPDMAMTAENLERAAKGCKNSDFVFVSADEDVEWGLVYDLAAVTQTLEEKPFRKVVLLPETPVAGRPVEL